MAIDYNGFLARRGFEELGRGMFSTVYAHPTSDKVIKVARYVDGWPEYILWAASHGFMGGLAPKVYSFRVIERDGYLSYVAVVERLAHTQADISPLKGWRWEWGTHPPAPCAKHEAATWMQSALYTNLARAGEPTPDILPYLPSDWRRFIDAWHASRPRCGCDLHGGNWMYRANGELVLTDPFTGTDNVDSVKSMHRMQSRHFAQLLAA